MWKNINDERPKINGAYKVFGTVNKGSEHETECVYDGYWDSGLNAFTDKDGEDLTGINEGVKFWFDFSQVPDPV